MTIQLIAEHPHRRNRRSRRARLLAAPRNDSGALSVGCDGAEPSWSSLSVSESVVVTIHLAATAAMVGLIWFVQLVHYPLFAAVGADGFTEYEKSHQQRTSLVVGPLMAAEGITAVWLALVPPPAVGRFWPLIGLAVLGVVHASTVLLQVPQHTALSSGYESGRVRRLVRTNWIRTAGWSIRGIIAALIVIDVVST